MIDLSSKVNRNFKAKNGLIMRYSRFVLRVLLAVAFLLCSVASAQSLLPGNLDPGQGPITMRADEVVYWRGENRYIARGNVVVTTQRFTITCDEIEVWNETGVMEARGHARIEGEDINLSTDSIRISTKSEEGVIVNATLYIAQPHTTISGERIEKIGGGRYLIKGASFTTCLCEEGERPDWSIRAKSINARENGFAFAKGATFRVKDMPIFYAPYGAFPVKRERQTGLLIPRADYSSRDGPEFVLPFYWAAARWWDMTIEEDFIRDRGFKQNIELRWLRSPGRGGQLRLFYLDDWKVDDNRAAGLWNGGYTLPYGFRLNQEIRVVSDNEYPRDFINDRVNGGDSRARSLESRLLLIRPFDSAAAYAFFSYLDHLAGDDTNNRLGFPDKDGAQPQRLPTVGFRLAPVKTPGLPLWLKFAAAADTFYREGPVSAFGRVGISRKGEWSERVDLSPSVMLPLESGAFYFIPELGFRETVWSVPDSDAAARHLALGRAEAGLRAYRVYRGRFKHRIEPRVRYIWAEDMNESARPHFDLMDDVGDMQVVQLNLDQRLYVRRADSYGTLRGHELARLEITQDFMADEGKFGVLRAELETRPAQIISIAIDEQYDLKAGDFLYASATANLRDKRKDSLQVGYRFQDRNEQLVGTRAEIRTLPWLGLTYFHAWDADKNAFIDHGGGFVLEPKSDCWTLDFSATYHTDPQDLRFAVKFVLIGLGAAGR